MVRKCYVCKRIYDRRESSVSFHKFPCDEKISFQWFEVFGLQPVKDKVLHLCSDHFSIEDFSLQLNGRRVLKKNAFPKKGLDHDRIITRPQVFEHFELKPRVAFGESSHTKVSTSALDPLAETTREFNFPQYVGHIDSDTILKLRRAKRNIKLARNKLMQKRQKIRYLHQQRRQLNRKIDTLKAFLNQLTNTT